MSPVRNVPARDTRRDVPRSTWRRASWLLVLLALCPPAALAAEEENQLRAESEVRYPPFPQAENLIPFSVSATTNNEFMIDGASLTVSPDRVVRYTLVIVSPAGARNVSYEAMNCSTGERRLYAVGRSDGTWAKARTDKWVAIRESTLNRHHAALFREYFCSIGVTLRDAEDARRILRTGGDRTKLLGH
ncbi:MAG: CNP1-like family protein [Candidatus Accumulibacter sp.]|nr:CNP1-like family protein [Accumulibacter sp.]